MTLRIGLTGGIGSGKTVVSKVFQALGIPIYYADAEAKRIMNEDIGLRTQIIALFGDEAYTNGQLNRAFIASIVFSDQRKLDGLNALVHPSTIRAGERWMQAQTTPYAIKEAALIFESGSEAHLDYVIGVLSPAALRMSRVMARDNASVEQITRRMNSQLDEAEKMDRCDFVIINDEHQAVIPQVLAVHEALMKKAGLGV